MTCKELAEKLQQTATFLNRTPRHEVTDEKMSKVLGITHFAKILAIHNLLYDPKDPSIK